MQARRQLNLKRTSHAKLVLDRKGKHAAIKREYEAWQKQLQGNDESLYSATKQQAQRFTRRIRKQNGIGIREREYPMVLRHDCVKIQYQKDSVFR